jgi:hypothetical protein
VGGREEGIEREKKREGERERENPVFGVFVPRLEHHPQKQKH